MTSFEVLKAIISTLDKLEIPYMLAGSFASGAHGTPRTTMDADLIVELKPSQVERLVAAFQGDFYIDPGSAEQAVRAKRSFSIIHLTTFFKADLFVLGESAFAREEFSRRAPYSLAEAESERIYLATPEDTILSKLAWFRQGREVSENQWRDVLGIIRVQGRRLNLPYLHRWANELGLSSLLECALAEAGLEN